MGPRPKNLLRQVSEWATQEEFLEIAIAVSEERNWIDGPICDSPRDLLEAHGLLADDSYHELDSTHPAVDNVVKILKECPSWGEFFGAVLASFHLFTKEDQETIRPAMMEVAKHIAENGCDH